MTYCQITAAERYTLSLLRRQGCTPAAIARVLGRHRSTIGRELHRNANTHDGWYRPEKAKSYAITRRSRSRRNRPFTVADWQRVHLPRPPGWQ
jgi:transposase, IS30 family